MRTARTHTCRLLVVASLVATACQPSVRLPEADRGVAGAITANVSRCLPKGWRLDAISQAVPFPEGEPGLFPTTDIAVLAWRAA